MPTTHPTGMDGWIESQKIKDKISGDNWGACMKELEKSDEQEPLYTSSLI